MVKGLGGTWSSVLSGERYGNRERESPLGKRLWLRLILLNDASSCNLPAQFAHSLLERSTLKTAHNEKF